MYVSDTNKHICMCMYAGMCVGVTADECVHMCMCVYLELSYRGIMILPKATGCQMESQVPIVGNFTSSCWS